MKFNVILKTARKAVIELIGQGFYYTDKEYEIYINNTLYTKSTKVVQSIHNLKPDTEYSIYVKSDTETSEVVVIKTEYEFVTLNVKEFGAKGDGAHDDTTMIQCAINSCPKDGRVLIPEGCYKISTLFLKSDLRLELAKGAVLSAFTDRSKFPILPGRIESFDETDEYNLGSWEGNPLDSFAGIILVSMSLTLKLLVKVL